MLVNKELLKDTPLSYHASFLRFGGLTSYASLIDIGKPKEGETIYVSVCIINSLNYIYLHSF